MGVNRNARQERWALTCHAVAIVVSGFDPGGFRRHSFVIKGFFECDDQLLQHASGLRHIPGVIVHRRYPEADLIITPDSGHSPFDPPNSRHW